MSAATHRSSMSTVTVRRRVSAGRADCAMPIRLPPTTTPARTRLTRPSRGRNRPDRQTMRGMSVCVAAYSRALNPPLEWPTRQDTVRPRFARNRTASATSWTCGVQSPTRRVQLSARCRARMTMNTTIHTTTCGVLPRRRGCRCRTRTSAHSRWRSPSRGRNGTSSVRTPPAPQPAPGNCIAGSWTGTCAGSMPHVNHKNPCMWLLSYQRCREHNPRLMLPQPRMQAQMRSQARHQIAKGKAETARWPTCVGTCRG